ncbi:hypothetical protein QWY82_00985 [Simiduia curdlanivorans]|uniref:Peptidase n=1 Tax=Simiduia curdlanivorans TaxID=1492769 RepID=A0ABV8V5F3_9GAMM|nr:hypothetical protein [Simiduia curdlanivorans]MDN3637369.1 hypothetical protein [Simiduia curdlanivorans]
MAVTLYVWKNSPSEVGHASLDVDGVYISFWPKGAANAKKDVKIGEMHDAAYPSSYAVDRKIERREADVKVMLDNLDEKAIKAFWQAFKDKSEQYNMLKSNCSTVTAMALEAGSGLASNRSPSIKISDYVSNTGMQWLLKVRFMGNYIQMWTPNDVLTYALQIKSQSIF